MQHIGEVKIQMLYFGDVLGKIGLIIRKVLEREKTIINQLNSDIQLLQLSIKKVKSFLFVSIF